VTVKLHHQIYGALDAPSLVLGGSLGTELSMWAGQLPLASDLRLVAFDHRGHGGSPAPGGPYSIADLGGDVLELMDELGLERASYCGLSLGGMVGMWLGVNAPERIERLILLCTAAQMPNGSAYADRAVVVRSEGSVESIADGVLRRWLTPGFAAQQPEIRDWLREMLVGTDAEGYASCCEAIAGLDLRGDLGSIGAPTLVISGAEDIATPVELQELIAGAIPGARHEVVASAAHLAAVEQPDRINQLIGDHLR
jgi:3-oxoadipate enol-lactonase